MALTTDVCDSMDRQNLCLKGIDRRALQEIAAEKKRKRKRQARISAKQNSLGD
jgi:hypothetical protein